jgi:type IV pilus assembly protein PilW
VNARGFSLSELLVALLIGALVVAAALSVFLRSMSDYRLSDRTARLTDNARQALDLLEREIRSAGYWGLTDQGAVIAGHAALDAPVPAGLNVGGGCATNLALDLETAVTSADARYAVDAGHGLVCRAAPSGRSQPGADTLTIRRANSANAVPERGRLQLSTRRTSGRLVADGSGAPGANGAELHDLEASVFYVSMDSTQRPGLPSLRRKRLTGGSGGPRFEDEELVTGIEDLQIELGLDSMSDADDIVDHYVDPTTVPPAGAARTVRLWVLARAEDTDATYTDALVRRYANRELAAPRDGFRRVLVSRTVLIRNAHG